MNGKQLKQDRGEGSPAEVWRAAEPIIVAGLGAHLAIVMMSESASQAPLLTAIVSSLVFAAVILAYTSRRRSNLESSTPPALLQLQTAGLALLTIATGAWLTRWLLGTGAAFYCEPRVPWRIEIALFGSLAVGYLTSMARTRRRAWVVYPLVMVASLSIAPFYGFFSAPLFLAVSLSSMCPDRPITTVLLTALGMIAGEQGGRGLVGWIHRV
jgi:hypothetical protein